ncbi:MAG: hypothetical protein GXO79_16060 [Chlorobi bacterium]|nr:hypothetical protein [Chlorobiota bacterium]
MQEKTEFVNLLISYSYLGIVFYYFVLDFISPLTEEISFLTIAYIASSNLLNIYIAVIVTILSLVVRNIFLYLIATKPTKWRHKLYKQNSKLGDNFQKKISKDLFYTILFFTFIPKIRILVPIIAGIGKVNKHRFILYESIAQTAFIITYFTIGAFFYKSFNTYLQKINSTWQIIFLISILVISILISFLLGKKYINRLSK